MANEKQQTLAEIVSEVEAYFKSLSYSNNRMHTFRKGWHELEEYMRSHSVDFYNPMIGKAFIESILDTELYAEIDKARKEVIRSTNILTEYQATGTVKFRSVLKTHEFKGEIGRIMTEYLSYRECNGFSKGTTDCNRLYLHRFLEHLEAAGIKEALDIDKPHILMFIISLGFYSKATIHCMLSALRGFLKYLQIQSYVSNDLSYLVPKSGYKKDSHLPTTYKKDEIERLIKAVDRGNPKGKRDFVMILLAARLGLRASDICGLKFESLNWETNTITIVQQKTKRKIELPLLDEIGNAIIDYLKYGRPESALPYVFIHVNQPYDRLAEPTLHSIVFFYLKRAGIKDINEKKHGPHALRHSLAGFLLEKKTPLPIISEVLGHSNTESTKPYLTIDLNSLRQCSLEVPPLSSPFYMVVN